MKIDRFNRILREIEGLISKRHGARAEKSAKQKITSLAAELATISELNPYVIEKASTIKRWGDILFSPGQHQEFKSKTESGAAVATRVIRSALHALSLWPAMDSYLRGIKKN